MVGTSIGALRGAPVGPNDKSVDYALALISGWANKDKEPFTADLLELKEAARHNAKIYKQGSDALNELSKRERDVRELAATAQAMHQQAVTASNKHAGDLVEANREIANQRAALEEKAKADTDAAEERERAVNVREEVVKRGKAEVDRLQASLAASQATADKLMADAQTIKSKFESKAQRVKRIIDEP